MQKLGVFMVFGGLFLAFGAVGGMESIPVWEPNPDYWLQAMAAVGGMISSFLGLALMGRSK